jgi:hypothetical protein
VKSAQKPQGLHPAVPPGWDVPYPKQERVWIYTPFVNLYLRDEGDREVLRLQIVDEGRVPKWSPPRGDRPWMRLEVELGTRLSPMTRPPAVPYYGLPVHAEEDGDDGLVEREAAVAVTVLAVLEGEYELRVRYELVGGEARYVGHSLAPVDGLPSKVGARQLRRLGFGGVVEEAFGWFLQMPDLFGEPWLQRPRRPGRAGTDDSVYAEWAGRYVDALEVDPRRPVQHLIEDAAGAGEHITASKVRAYLNRARARGLLTDAPPGQPGGELTDKARDLLRSADEAAAEVAAARRVARAFDPKKTKKKGKS